MDSNPVRENEIQQENGVRLLDVINRRSIRELRTTGNKRKAAREDEGNSTDSPFKRRKVDKKEKGKEVSRTSREDLNTSVGLIRRYLDEEQTRNMRMEQMLAHIKRELVALEAALARTKAVRIRAETGTAEGAGRSPP